MIKARFESPTTYVKEIRFPLSPSFKLLEFRHLLTFCHLRFATCPTFLTLGSNSFFYRTAEGHLC